MRAFQRKEKDILDGVKIGDYLVCIDNYTDTGKYPYVKKDKEYKVIAHSNRYLTDAVEGTVLIEDDEKEPLSVYIETGNSRPDNSGVSFITKKLYKS